MRTSTRLILKPLEIMTVFARSCVLLCVMYLAAVILSTPTLAKGLASSPPEQDKWQVNLASHKYGPTSFLAIDKKKQQLFLLEQRSPLSLQGKFKCTTGSITGDKLEEGDLKTPEGVYFVQRKLNGGLDYDLYGDLAFTLNFPNPVDKLLGKTGSGIWIHGRGHDITPRETKGCVAMNNPDLHNLAPKLGPGMAVLIAGDVSWSDQFSDSEVPQELVHKVQDWANAWGKKDEAFFSFYSPELFSEGQGSPFSAFRDHKENLFRKLPWLQVMIDDVQVMAGPGYWVTWFSQFYRSTNLTSEGVKRLYWMRDESGELRIVGKEWDNLDLGLGDRYLTNVSGSALRFIESWRAAWEKADLHTYVAFYADTASQGGRKGLKSIEEHKSRLWKDKPPMQVGIDDLEIDLDPKGIKVSFLQKYTAQGYTDNGLKTLYLQPYGDTWRIVDEDWDAI